MSKTAAGRCAFPGEAKAAGDATPAGPFSLSSETETETGAGGLGLLPGEPPAVSLEQRVPLAVSPNPGEPPAVSLEQREPLAVSPNPGEPPAVSLEQRPVPLTVSPSLVGPPAGISPPEFTPCAGLARGRSVETALGLTRLVDFAGRAGAVEIDCGRFGWWRGAFCSICGPEIAPPVAEIAPPAPEIASPAPEITPPAPEIAPIAPEIAPPVPEIALPVPEIAPPALEIASLEAVPALLWTEIASVWTEIASLATGFPLLGAPPVVGMGLR